jgi:imidazolonepropionase-like amidohydrolase
MSMERKRSRVSPLVAVIAMALACAACQPSAPPLVTKPAGPPPRIRITNVFVFDGRVDGLMPPQDVVLDGGRVEGIVRKGMLPAEGELVIDGTGKILMPGLVDVHGHTGSQSAPSWSSAGGFPDAARNLQSYLYAGVTTVFDPGDLAPDVFDRREAVARGELLGPTIFTAGPMFTTPGGHPVGALHGLVPWWIRWHVQRRMTREVGTPEEARAAVAGLLPSRPDFIKVAVDAVPLGAPTLGGDVLKAIVDEARAHGVRTVAHVGTVADALAAAHAGVAAWMHGVYKERIPDEALARFKAARIPYVATTFVFDDYADLIEGKRTSTALERETVPADVLASLDTLPPDALPEDFHEFMKLLAATREVRCDNLRRVSAAGIPILAGADAQLGVFPGPALHREIDALIRCGVAPFDAIRAATSAAARFVTGQDEPEFGIVRNGSRADLLLVNGNPLVEPAALHSIVLVIKDGRVLERHPLVAGGPTARPAGS